MVETKPVKKERARFNFNYFKTSNSDINDKLKDLQSTIKDEHWREMRSELLSNFDLSEENVDSRLIDLINYHNNGSEVAIEYIKFLIKNNYNLNLGVIAKYFKSVYFKGQPLTEKEEKELYEMYDSVRQKHPVLDASMCTDCILAISLTKRWEECFQLLDMMKYSGEPGVLVYEAIISTAFKNNKPEIGWEYMNSSIVKLPVHHNAYLAHLNYCKRNLKNKKLQEEIEKIFLFWREHSVKPSENVVKRYCEVYATFGYTSNFTSITKQGLCRSCSSILPETTLTSAEFKLLSVGVLKNVIIGSNVFCSTSPQELKKYMLFIKTMTPYDVVIDGLNVAYAKKGPDTKRGSLEMILSVVKKFTRENKRVLIIGRAHMNWWNKEVMQKIEQQAQIYFVKNISQDDPFLLHVTLMSGPQTYFVSRDLMRQHKFKLDKSLRNLFKRWQLSRQYLFETDQKSFNVQLLNPILFDVAAQHNENGWHIPYVETESLMMPAEYTQPRNWVCMTKNRNVKKITSKKQGK